MNINEYINDALISYRNNDIDIEQARDVIKLGINLLFNKVKENDANATEKKKGCGKVIYYVEDDGDRTWDGNCGDHHGYFCEECEKFVNATDSAVGDKDAN